MSEYPTNAGRPHPLGATVDANGVNFSLYTGPDATGVTLLLFNEHDDPQPVQVVSLTQNDNKTFYLWHVYVEGLKPGLHYAYKVEGPGDPAAFARGDRYSSDKVLLDPYARGVTQNLWNRAAACVAGDNLGTSMRGAIIDESDYDWEGDRPLNTPVKDTIIYEMHVGGFTRSPNSGCTYPGTFLGVIEKIPHLVELGVTAVELLPVFHFDPKEIERFNPNGGASLTNYWGYSPVAFFSPHEGYCVRPAEGSHVCEFRDMVKALHKAGIEVILDVVFNHSGEGNQDGPTISFRGLDNGAYYLLDPADRTQYLNFSGCGNTINCNHPVTEKLIVECLEYWVQEMHVDGFRFDLGSVLTRGEDGVPLRHPPLVWNIELSDALANTKVIAEAWDAGGLYQLGDFPGYRWGEWNGLYRDAVRRFVKGEDGMVGEIARRVAGSADLYEQTGELPTNSINFVTCHDGFTMNDLVSYAAKHNEANGENNADGTGANYSWNWGAEGETDDPQINQLRRRLVKNFAAILMLSQGVPMLLMGDEGLRTQRGNNNAYCQDNDTSWFDWERLDHNRDIFRFFKLMIATKKRFASLRRTTFFTGAKNERGLSDISWHGSSLNAPNWDDPSNHALAFTLAGFDGAPDLHVMLNMEWRDLDFELPQIATSSGWRRLLDTSLASPDDASEPGKEPPVEGDHYSVKGRSVVALVSAN